jgi:uncharacterized protein YkwD
VDLVDRPVVIGRSVDCDVQITEERASRKHFVVEPTDRGWVLRDCDSSNGTAINGYGISRALLTPGDVIEVGGLEILYEGDGPSSSHVHRPARKQPSSAMAWVGALVAFLSIAVATDQIVMGSAEQRQGTVDRAVAGLVAAEYRMASAESDPLRQETALEAFLKAHPSAKESAGAREKLDALRSGQATRKAAVKDLEELRRLQPSLSAEEYRWRLDAIVRRWADDPGASAELRRVHGSAEPGSREDARVLFQRHRREANGAADGGDFGRAVALWMAHAAEIPPGQTHTMNDLRAEVGRIESRASQRAEELLSRAGTLRDQDKRDEAETVLREGLAGLRGTEAGRRIQARLDGGLGPSIGRPAGGGSTARANSGGSSREPESAASSARRRSLWLQANEAEQFVALRDYGEASRRYRSIASGADDAPGVQEELSARADELKAVAMMMESLRSNPKGWGGKPFPESWDEVKPHDLHRALSRAARSTEDHLVVAGFAYDQSMREQARASVASALDKAGEDKTKIEQAGRLFAHREGRDYPSGGFVAEAGEVITRTEWNRRRNAEQIAKLHDRQESLMKRLRKSKVVRSIEKIAEMRSELDRAREHALDLIFDEETYFYPYRNRMKEYTPVQKEVDNRVAAVREIWDNKATIKTKADSSTAGVLRDLDEVGVKLRQLGAEPTLLETELETLRRYFDLTLTVRNYFIDPGEKEAFALNTQVMEWNDKNPGVAKTPEAKQVEITNDYRVMFGRRALKIADKLVLSSRAHGDDMSRGGFFDHFNVKLRNRKPGDKIPEQACGCSSDKILTGCSHGPDARIRQQGYGFMACSENIHAGSGDPLGAHNSWCHSSGHHRNILQQAWTEMGTGQVGRYWTQNFGLPIPEDDGDGSGGGSRWDNAGGRGTGGDGNDPEDER